MSPAKANLVNSISLITMGLWGYSVVTSPTALIPVGFGIVLLICYIFSVKKPSSKMIVAHVAILFTLIILAALLGMRLPKSLDSGGLGLVRVLTMISTSILAIVYFVKNFIDTRKEKNKST